MKTATVPQYAHLVTGYASDLLAVLNGEQHFLYVSPSFFNELGYNSDELTGAGIGKLVHHEDLPQFQQRLEALINENEPFLFTCRFANKSGHWLIFETTASRVNDPEAGEASVVLISRDVTIRSQTEAALAASEARYRNLTKVSPVGIFQCNENRFCLFANRHWCRLAGLSQDDALGEGWLSSIYPADRLRLLDEWQLAVKHNQPFKMEYRFQHYNKDIIWVYGEGTAVRNDAGKITGYIETIIDITERKRTELALQESEKRYRQIVDFSPDTVIVHSKGKIVYANTACVKMFGGKSDRDFIGRPVMDFVHPSYKEKVQQRVRQANSQDASLPPIHEKLIRLDGTTIEAEVVAAPITYMGDPAIQVVVRDITERRQSEKRMSMLAHAIRSISECVILSDLEDQILFVNDAFQQTYGYSAEELAGKSVSLIRPAQDLPGIQEIREATLQGGWQGEVINRRKDGSEFAVFLSTSPVRDSHGNPVATVGIAKDITRQHRSERALNQTARQVQYLQKMESISRLAEGIAHEFNNLLTIITGYTQLSLVNSQAGEEIKRNLNKVLQAGEKAADLIHNLLAFGRRQFANPMVLDLNKLLGEMRPAIRQTVGDSIKLHLALEEQLGYIRVDRSQLEMIINHLVSNARDAMPEGGELTIETGRIYWDESYARMHLADVEPGPYCMLAVSDSGCGMDPETVSRVFEPFFSTKPSGKGAGLGMSAVYGMVKQSGGYIWIFSQPGEGTAVKIYLPQIDEQPEHIAPVSRPQHALVGSETVLLVEDDEAVRNVAETILKRYGYTVYPVSNGEAALASFRAHRNEIQVLLTDLGLPDTRGAELAARLLAERPDLKVLYMSGYAPGAIFNQGLLNPEDALIQKPFTPEMLAKRIRKLLSADPENPPD